MIILKTDWKVRHGRKVHAIYDENTLSVIVSDIEDYHTLHKLHRSREMYELLDKLLTSVANHTECMKFSEPIENILQEIKILKQEIDRNLK